MPALNSARQILHTTAPSAAPRLHLASSTASALSHNVHKTSRLLRPTTPFSTSAVRNSSSESHYEPPSGWLWGVPPGQKREKEGWENIWFWGFYGSIGLGIVGWSFKPDSNIETWALEEAKRRLQAEGTLPEDE